MENTGSFPGPSQRFHPVCLAGRPGRSGGRSLYTFTTTDQVLGEFVRCVEQNKERFIDKTFHSLDILNAVMDNAT